MSSYLGGTGRKKIGALDSVSGGVETVTNYDFLNSQSRCFWLLIETS